MNKDEFRHIVRDFYTTQGRHTLPWRNTRDPYKILVSEIMLQQTQVDRVVSKYRSFLKKFPTVAHLAQARTEDVLREWQGLGYNRRALYLKRASEVAMRDFGGKLPRDYNTLLSLPGIGPATAGDILIFAYNEPHIVIETNIRTVFIHHFFPRSKKVPDKKLLPLIADMLDTENPREWYAGLMDYGTHLKKTIGNTSRKSAHYKKQSTFKGSFRQLRAHILREYLQSGTLPTPKNKEEKRALESLKKDGLV